MSSDRPAVGWDGLSALIAAIALLFPTVGVLVTWARYGSVGISPAWELATMHGISTLAVKGLFPLALVGSFTAILAYTEREARPRLRGGRWALEGMREGGRRRLLAVPLLVASIGLTLFPIVFMALEGPAAFLLAWSAGVLLGTYTFHRTVYVTDRRMTLRTMWPTLLVLGLAAIVAGAVLPPLEGTVSVEFSSDRMSGDFVLLGSSEGLVYLLNCANRDEPLIAVPPSSMIRMSFASQEQTLAYWRGRTSLWKVLTAGHPFVPNLLDACEVT